MRCTGMGSSIRWAKEGLITLRSHSERVVAKAFTGLCLVNRIGGQNSVSFAYTCVIGFGIFRVYSAPAPCMCRLKH